MLSKEASLFHCALGDASARGRENIVTYFIDVCLGLYNISRRIALAATFNWPLFGNNVIVYRRISQEIAVTEKAFMSILSPLATHALQQKHDKRR